jgi:hypothetical protein
MKTYETPTVTVFEIHTEGMIAGSRDNVTIDPGTPGIPATNGMHGRWNNFPWENSSEEI